MTEYTVGNNVFESLGVRCLSCVTVAKAEWKTGTNELEYMAG